MNRRHLILLLLFLSWPVNNIHRLWNHAAPRRVYWFPADNYYWKDIQWYVHDVSECICYIFILFACWLYINSSLKRDRSVRIMFGSVLVNQLIDLPHYLWSARHSEWIITIQGAILLTATLIMTFNAKTHGKGC